VIQLNLVRNVNTILDILERELSDPTARSNSDFGDDLEITEIPITRTTNNSSVQLADKYHRLNLRLSPLRKVQKDLEARLGAASSEETSVNGVYDPSLGLNVLAERRERYAQEFSINSRNGWKSALTRVIPGNSLQSGAEVYGIDNGAGGDSITEAIASSRGNMVALWADPMVQDILSRAPSRIQESPGL
jgi:guanine nucleotide-binding protein subunit alpha